MNELYLVGSAVYNLLKTNGSIDVYHSKAPQSATTDYALIYFVTSNDEYTFNDKGLSGDYQLKVVSSKNFPDSAIQMYGYLHDLLQDANLNLPNYDSIRVRRQSTFLFEDQKHFWNVGGLYAIEIWQQ